MRNTLTLLLFCIFALGACCNKTQLKVDRITETEQEEHWDVRMSYSVFSSETKAVEEKCLLFNDELKGLAHCAKAAFLEQADKRIKQLDSTRIENSAPYVFIIADTVFLANEKYISLLVHQYQMLGGANGQLDFYGLNFDIEANKFLEKADIFHSEKSADINALLEKYLQDPEGCYTFEKPTLENCTAVNFTDKSVEFTYTKYILGPGACGPVTISVPKDLLKAYMKLK